MGREEGRKGECCHGDSLLSPSQVVIFFAIISLLHTIMPPPS